MRRLRLIPFLAISAVAWAQTPPESPSPEAPRAGIEALALPGTQGLAGSALPKECGGAPLPTALPARLSALEACLVDLKKRNEVEVQVASLRKAQAPSFATPALTADADFAVSALNAFQNKEDRRPERSAKTPQKLPDLELVGGGCGEICLAIFRLGQKTYPVRKAGDFVTANATVSAIENRHGRLHVTLRVTATGGKVETQEFSL